MWGNRLGWGISAAIVLATMVLLYLFIQLVGAVTPPTELVTDGLALARIQLPVRSGDMLAAEGNDDRDAGELYRDAIEHYQADPQVYQRFLSQPQPGISLRGVDRVLEAANCRRMNLFADRLEDVVMIRGERPAIVAITAVGRATIIAGLLSKKTDAQAARRHFAAAFTLGAWLFDERIVYEELQAGMQLMSESSRALASLEQAAGNAAEQSRWIEFDEKRLDYFRTNIQPVLRVVSSIDANVVDRHAGDIARIAQEAQDRMWRVEATMTLGRQRFFVGRVGDQRAAIRVLNLLTHDSDPAVALAARKALDMTIEEYRQLR